MDNTNLKSLLKTGTFGQTDEGLFFVVAGDRLVYESGGFDEIADFNDELICVDDFGGEILNSVEFIFKDICRCFDYARHIAKFKEQIYILWSREDYEKEKEMKILKSTNTPSMPECKEPKKETTSPTLSDVSTVVEQMYYIMTGQGKSSDEIMTAAKNIYKQFGYELPKLD